MTLPTTYITGAPVTTTLPPWATPPGLGNRPGGSAIASVNSGYGGNVNPFVTERPSIAKKPEGVESTAVTVVQSSISMTMSLPNDASDEMMMKDQELITSFSKALAKTYEVDVKKIQINGFNIAKVYNTGSGRRLLNEDMNT